MSIEENPQRTTLTDTDATRLDIAMYDGMNDILDLLIAGGAIEHHYGFGVIHRIVYDEDTNQDVAVDLDYNFDPYTDRVPGFTVHIFTELFKYSISYRVSAHVNNISVTEPEFISLGNDVIENGHTFDYEDRPGGPFLIDRSQGDVFTTINQVIDYYENVLLPMFISFIKRAFPCNQ